MYNFAPKNFRKMKRNYLPYIVAFLLILGTLQCLRSQDTKSRNIVEVLSAADTTNNATVRIFEDKRIEQLMSNKRSSGNSRVLNVNGFRVQVFSSNAQHTAKTDAFRIEKEIRDQFPEQTVYVNYFSPFWKVRVGDFRTQAQAQAFRSQLINNLPQLRGEVYVVREQITITGK